jgi:hypothetical protein
MYAHVENGSIDFQGELPTSWRNISGLNLSKDDNAYLKSLGWLPLTETNVTPDSDEVLDSDQVIINEDDVQIVHRVRSMTTDELTLRDVESWQNMRQLRNELLGGTDFYALSDVTMSSDMTVYRQALRDLPANIDDPTNITWPVAPGS